MKRAVLILMLLILTVACIKSSPLTAPELGADIPGDWTATESGPGEISDRWWEDFNDPGLTRTIETALANNNDLAAAAARLERAAAQARIAGADLKPAVGAGLSGRRQKQNFAGSGLGSVIPSEEKVLAFTTSSYGVSLDLSWEVDLWGKLRASTRAALADLQAAEATYQAARLSLAGQTAKAYFAVAEAGQQVQLAERTVESWREAYEQVRDRYRVGLRSSLDLRLSLSNLERAEALLLNRKRQLDGAERQLEVIMGLYPGRQLESPGDLPPLPSRVPAGLPAELVIRRPDLVAAERSVVAADQRYAAARRSLYPSFSLTASGGSSSDSLSNLLDGDYGVWSLAGNLLQPIFQGGRLRANVDAGRAAADELLANFAGTALKAFAEVESGLAAERMLTGRLEHVESAANQAAAALVLAENRYDSGLEQFITVLDSRRSSLEADGQLLSARRELLDNRVDIYLALGGGFNVDEEAAR